MLPDRIAELLPRVLADHACVERALVFGSRARGDATERSDIDLAIAAPQASDSEWVALLTELDNLPTLLELDIVRLEQAPMRFRTRILAEGVVVYER